MRSLRTGARPLYITAALLVAGACGATPTERGTTDPEQPPSGAAAATDEPATPRGGAQTDRTTTDPEHSVHTNRLAQESSPYLLQHQHNPVDWHPWGEAAFKQARDEDKPIFLSIGYSTCHWCHVMERESFEDEATAAVMNEHFICIKVDREERPDVDAVYMKAVLAMTQGRGGWPLSVWLTPDLKPFYGGTYFPPESRYGRPSFTDVLNGLAETWRDKRPDVLTNAQQLIAHLQQSTAAVPEAQLSVKTLQAGVDQFQAGFDRQHGGFGPAPKFPSSFDYWFLLREHARAARAGEPTGETKTMVESTLDEIWRGGIHDHLGGGVHRYSTDAEWLLPHFEKMLYDQALIARAYIEAYQLSGDAHHAEAARDVIEYVLRDLRDDGGAFHSAEDADSEGVEGKFYVWTRAEIVDLLGEEDGALFCEVYEVTTEGNFIDEAERRKTGANILHLRAPLGQLARVRGEDADEFATRLAAMRGKLLAVRGGRIRPHLDDKVLTDWNGLMIGTLAYAGAALDEPRYTQAAVEAATFLQTTMDKQGRLLHRYRKGQAGIDGFLEDHAFLCVGLVDLYQATFDPRWLAWAKDLAGRMVTRFRNAEGTFDLSAHDAEELITASRDLYDGATPSGNSAAAVALLRIGRMTGDAELESAGRRTLTAWSGTIARFPRGYTFSLLGLAFDLGPSREIVIAGDPDQPATRALIRKVRDTYLPNAVVLLHPTGPAGAAIEALAPFVAAQKPVDGAPAVYVCESYSCRAPVTTPEALEAALE